MTKSNPETHQKTAQIDCLHNRPPDGVATNKPATVDEPVEYKRHLICIVCVHPRWFCRFALLQIITTDLRYGFAIVVSCTILLIITNV